MEKFKYIFFCWCIFNISFFKVCFQGFIIKDDHVINIGLAKIGLFFLWFLPFAHLKIFMCCYILYMLHLAVWKYWIKTWWVIFTQCIAWWKIGQSMRCFIVVNEIYVPGRSPSGSRIYTIFYCSKFYLFYVSQNKNPKLERSQS